MGILTTYATDKEDDTKWPTAANFIGDSGSENVQYINAARAEIHKRAMWMLWAGLNR